MERVKWSREVTFQGAGRSEENEMKAARDKIRRAKGDRTPTPYRGSLLTT